MNLISEAPEHYRSALAPFVMTAPDGMRFLDYFYHLYGVWREHGIDVVDILIEHKEAVMSQIARHKSNAHVLDKFRWTAEYHNHKIPSFYDPDDYEEEEFKELINNMMIPMSLFPSYQTYKFDPDRERKHDK